jgi:hypothetical protein
METETKIFESQTFSLKFKGKEEKRTKIREKRTKICEKRTKPKIVNMIQLDQFLRY